MSTYTRGDHWFNKIPVTWIIMKRKQVSSTVKEIASLKETEPEGESASDSDDLDTDNEEESLGPVQTKGNKPIKKDEGEPRFKYTKLSNQELYKPPTNEEINRLRETENLFHSTLFRMEITELLSEIKVKERRRLQMSTAIETLKDILSSLEPGKKYTLDNRKWLKKSKIQLPVPDEPPDGAGYFQFLPPKDVRLTGSFVTDTGLKPDIHVDMIIEMPKELFSEKDYLNHRYSRKRALYLCHVASVLKSREELDTPEFMYHHSNHLKPILSINMPGHKPVEIRIDAVPEPDSFKLSRFHVNKNNVRCRWFYQSDPDRQTQEDCPTPYSNSTVLEDLVSSETQQCVQRLQSQPTGIKDGLILLKLWLRQRELDVGHGGFSGFLMGMFVLHLLYKKKLSSHMSSYQIMRNTLLRLSQSDWTTSGISLCKDTSDMYMPTMSDFYKHFEVVFVDQTGYLNLCYCMNKSFYQRVVQEASQSVAMLDDKDCNSFEFLFMHKLPFSLTFDHIFHISAGACAGAAFETAHKQGRYVDYFNHSTLVALPAIMLALQRGLGNRVNLLQSQLLTLPKWSILESPPDVQEPQRISFGLLLNSDNAHNILDRGPSADTAEAKEFRQFWGDRSELRRFHGGGICEAVLWSDKDVSVCQQIVQYVLQQHVGIPARHIRYLGQHLDPMLTLPIAEAKGANPYNTGEGVNSTVIQVLDDLGRMLHKLEDLPLTITSIQGVSPCFRFTDVFPPFPCTVKLVGDHNNSEGVKRFVPDSKKPCPWFIPSLKVVCTLESSGKWPDDVEALRRLKAAFYNQLARALHSRFNLTSKAATTHVDVIKDHFVFRLELGIVKEIALLKTIKTDGIVKKRDTEEALELEKRIIALPKITSVLHGLHKQHIAFGPTVRLVKRWISSHLLSDYIHPVAIELIVAHLFLAPEPLSTPSSPTVGFLRCLSFLSRFDWKTTPLIVNLNNEFTDDDKAEIPTRFSKERSTLPLMFISTPLNKYSSHWTKHSPTPVILQRLVLLAQKSLVILQQQMMDKTEPDYKHAFRPSYNAFDVLIHLKHHQIPRLYENLDVGENSPRPKYGLQVKEEDRFPALDFDPVQMFLTELKDTFGDICLFFYDHHGGHTISMLWKPNAMIKHDFKVSHINYSKLHTEETEVKLGPNVEAILEDIALIGKGLVKSVAVMDKAATPVKSEH